jgi:hypothetical protein
VGKGVCVVCVCVCVCVCLCMCVCSSRSESVFGASGGEGANQVEGEHRCPRVV